MKVIEGRHLTKIIGKKNNQRQILKNISIEVHQGEFVGVMGPSGAGKSTLLQILSTLTSPTVGEVYLKGQDVAKLKEHELSTFRNQEIGYIFQDFNLVETLNVRDNLALPLVIQKKNGKEITEKVQSMSRTFEIENLLEKFPQEISIGQKQRVAAVRAFIHEPSLVFADEPTGSLDSKNATQLLHYLTKRNQKEKSTILMVTHDPYSASFCHRVLFIKDGEVFAEIIRRDDRRQFLEKILQMQTALARRLEDESPFGEN